MNATIEELARLVGGRFTGDGSRIIRGAAPFENAVQDDVTFAGVPKLLKSIDKTDAGVVLVPESFETDQKTIIRVKNPQVAFIAVLNTYFPPKSPEPGISPGAHIGLNFTAGEGISIAHGVVIGDQVAVGSRTVLGANAVIGDQVTLGDDVVIRPNVTIMDGAIIGNRVTIHPGTVIGADGFGFAPDGDIYHKISHRGIVRIGDDVEIGSCNTIDRATFGETRIGNGVKTDNLVHIAHNVTIGDNTILVAQVGIAGSATIGKHAILAGQVGVTGHLTVGNNVTIGAQSGIAKSIPDGQIVSGSPEMPHTLWRRVVGIIPKLPEMKKKLAGIEKRLSKLEDN